MRIKKYHKSGTILLAILIFAALAVLTVVLLLYGKGLRYIKTQTGIKYFGFLNSDGIPTDGRIWQGDGTVITVKEQKFIAIEFTNPVTSGQLSSELAYDRLLSANGAFFLDEINSIIPDETRSQFPLDHFLLDDSGDIAIVKENFAPYIKYLEELGNYITECSIADRDGRLWQLSAVKAAPASYKDYEVVRSDDKSYKYGGDILDFLSKEKLTYGTIDFKSGTVMNLYGCEGISRMFYESGTNKGGVYIGRTDSDLERSGGIHFYEKTGDIYYGDFIDGKKTGQCMIKMMQGDCYAGEIVDSVREGMGKVVWYDGTSYEGQFKNGMRNGSGLTIRSNGTIYEGEYIDDYESGTGTWRASNGDVYEGEFKNGYFSGYGIYYWASGDVYEGEFKNNIINGYGTYKWAAGRTYTGYFADAKMTYERPPGEGEGE